MTVAAKRANGTKYGSASTQPPGATHGFLASPPRLLQEVAELVTREGDCLMLSRTRDMGAVHVRILADGLVEKWYAGNQAELDQVLEGIRKALGGSPS